MIFDILIAGATTYVDFQEIKNRYTNDGIALVQGMAGNEGQRTLTSRYADQIPTYVEEIVDDWDSHNWSNFIDWVGSDTSESGLRGTVVILSNLFDLLGMAVLEAQIAVAQNAADTVVESGGEKKQGRQKPMGGYTQKDIERKAHERLVSRRGGNWDDMHGIPSNWRHAQPGKELRDIRDRDDFYRRLDLPGIRGIRARFQAGGTDAQLHYFMTAGDSHVPTAIRVTNKRNGIDKTIVPGGHRWRDFNARWGLTGNRIINDPGGHWYDRIQAEWSRQIREGAQAYRHGTDNTNRPYATDMWGNVRNWAKEYNPYTMQWQHQNGQFAGPKTWENRSMPYGLNGSR